MLKNKLVRSAALAATAALAAGVGLVALAPTAAQAVVTGTATLSPANGDTGSLIDITTSGPCAAPATRVKAIATGFGFPSNGQVLVTQTSVGFSTTDPMTLPLSDSFYTYATLNASTALVGAYDVRVQCVNNLGSVVYDEFQTTMNWTTPGNSYANIESATYTSTVPGVATTTTLTPSVPSPQDEGTAITLTATVDGGASDPNAGTVEFFDGSTSLGTATVSGGVATKTGVVLPAGTRSLTAVFGGTTGFNSSTSPAVSYVINDVIVSTTTTLAVSGSGVQYDTATLDATVVPNNAVGTVHFFDGATQLGTRPLVSGTASFSTTTLGIGTHSLTAKFVPANANDYAESTSTAQSLEVVAPSGVQQNITTDIPAGALTISVLGDSAVLLPAALAADGSEYTATGQIDPVRVVDTRAGSLGWTASGQLSPFQQGGSPSISAANLGWAPSLTSTSNPALTVTPGATVAPAAHVAIGAGAGDGLSAIRTLATSPVGSSVGTAELGAALSLRAPTTTTPGTHTAVLTLTAI